MSIRSGASTGSLQSFGHLIQPDRYIWSIFKENSWHEEKSFIMENYLEQEHYTKISLISF